MSQAIFDTIVPSTTSGNQLAALLNDFKAAIVSGFSGTTRPSQLAAGGYWIDTTNDSSGLWDFKVYDGTQDIKIFTLNKNTGLASISGSDSLFEISKTSDSSVGPILRLLKERIAGLGQSKIGDTVGEIQFSGTRDDGVNVLQARIKSISQNDVTALHQGAYIAFEISPYNDAAISEVMRLVDGKVAIGTVTPDEALHVVGNAKVQKISDDTVGAKVILSKKRVAGVGQVQSGDVIASIEAKSVDDAGTEIGGFSFEVSANQNHTTSAHGTKVSIKNKKQGQTSFTEQVVIEDTVKVKTDMTAEGNLTVTGNLTVNGTTTTVNSTTTEVADANITVNKGGNQSSANTNKAGFKVEMSDATHAQIGYDSTKTSKFVAGSVGSESEIVTTTHAQTLTNKTLTSPVINTPTGITKSDVGLSNVDNTSDATKNAAVATLTNKTLTSPVINTPTGITKSDVGLSNVDNTSDATKNAAAVTLTNKTLSSPSIVTPTRSDVKQDTKANLVTYAATAANGQWCFATDEKKMYQVIDSALEFIPGSTYVPASVAVSALDINWSSGYVFYKDIAAASTFTFSNTKDGKIITVAIKNTAVTDVIIVLPTVIKRTDLELTVKAGKTNVYSFFSANGNVYATSLSEMA